MVADRDGTVLDAPFLPEAIAYDPILGSLKLIARPGDEALLPRGGDRGFPHWSMWAEQSPRFPRDLSRALNPFPHAEEDLQGRPTIASAIATRYAADQVWRDVHLACPALHCEDTGCPALLLLLIQNMAEQQPVSSSVAVAARCTCRLAVCSLCCLAVWVMPLHLQQCSPSTHPPCPLSQAMLLGRLMGSADLFAARWDEGLPGSLAAGRAPSFGINASVGCQQTWQQAVDACADADASRSQRSTLGKTMLTLALLSQARLTHPCHHEGPALHAMAASS